MDRIALGLYDGPSGGAALLHEGRLLAIAEEDRISRVSRVSGLPRASVQTVLHAAGVPPDEISAVIVATESSTYAEGVGGAGSAPWLMRMSEVLPSPRPLSRLLRDSFASDRRRRVDEALRSEFGISCPVRFADHHLTHATGAAFANGLADSLVVTMDAGADGVWSAVTRFAAGTPERLASEGDSPSVLTFLDFVAGSLGIPDGIDQFARLEELASRGSSRHYEQLAAHLRFEHGKVAIDEQIFRSSGPVSRVRASARKEDLAASALTLAGEIVRRYCAHWFVRTEADTLVLGGDLFEVPAIVRAVTEAPEIPRVRLAVSPGDVGLAVGAAYAACLPGFLAEPHALPEEPLASPFLGISYSNDTIEDVLRQDGVTFQQGADLERDIGRVLAEGRTVARFDAKAELGNQGLGNRAVLRSPDGPLRRGRIGFVLLPGVYHAIVSEDAFARHFDEEIDRAGSSAQPLLVKPKKEFAERYPDLLGWNGCVRVQVVTETGNPRLFRILQEFASWTGSEVLAAAPFRLPNEPLVSSPRDALRTFRLLGADFAAIGRYIVRGDHESTDPLATLETKGV